MLLPNKIEVDDTFAFIRAELYRVIDIENSLLNKYEEEIHQLEIRIAQIERNSRNKSDYFSPYESKKTDDKVELKNELNDLKDKMVLSQNNILIYQNRMDTINGIELYCDESFYDLEKQNENEEQEVNEKSVIEEQEENTDFDAKSIISSLKRVLSYIDVDKDRAKKNIKKVLKKLEKEE